MSNHNEAGSPTRRDEGSSAGCLALQSGEEVTELTEEIRLAEMEAADTNGEKAKRVLEILDEVEAGGEFDGLSADEKEIARQSIGMRLRADME